MDDLSPTVPRRANVAVIGGGNGGLSIAGRLCRRGVADIVVIEPQEEHCYKPLLSHVAGGTARASQTVRPQAAVTPKGVTWLQDAVAHIDAERNRLELGSGELLEYAHLVVAPGIRQDWDAVPGLAAAMLSPSGASNYLLDLAAKASPMLRDVRSGTVVFIQPPGPASCAGAAQKPMYQACAYWRRKGVLSGIRVVLLVPDATIFGIPEIDAELERKVAEYGIEVHTGARVQEIDADQRTVVFTTDSAAAGARAHSVTYDVLMAEPPQSAPPFIEASGLSSPDAEGFVDVDPRTLRHRRHANVWAVGDAAATTNSKSGGALRKQTKVLADNLVAVLGGGEPGAHYDGYGVCPFTVSRSSAVFAEFDDQRRLAPSIPFWRTSYRESRLAWIIDRHIFPHIYWHLILQGRA
jgi:sulfide:quinone oxidoreductase